MNFELYQPNEWQLWRGTEVEGRWRGLPTLFVGHNAHPQDIFALVRQAEHVYFNPPFFQRADAWETVERLLALGHPVTASGETNVLAGAPDAVLRHVHFHFMLVLVVPLVREIWQRLQPDDTIRLQLDGAYNCSFSVRTAIVCSEGHYGGDERVL